MDEGVLESVREDDYVEYYLFPQCGTITESEQELLLSSILEKCNEIVNNLTKEHLWHKDKFTLLPRTAITNKLIGLHEINGKLPPHLYGVTHFGENIEDEWLIVYLIIELTKKIPEMVAKICDADGEFLLIEAAESLPSWIKPETSENRVYLFGGKVHIVEPDSSEEIKDIDVGEAIEMIKNNSKLTEANNDIQQAILSRISGYPEKIKENLHTARAYIPVGVAAILKHKPNLISGVVHAFCNRDPVDIKACRAMKYFPPENRVYANVTFPKCLYAMINHSKFHPDKRTGWNLPNSNSSEFKSHSLGVKIACGFEILVSQAKPTQDLETDKSWHKYLSSLKERNYFNGNLEHSHEYTNLLNKAKEYYANYRDSMYYSPAIGQEILDLMRNLEYNLTDFKNMERDLPEEDDDSWLNVSPEELDKYLQERYGQKKFYNFNSNTDPTDFTQKISTFLNHVSDIDGAEFPHIQSPVRPPRGKKSKNTVAFTENLERKETNDNINSNKKETESNKINFDPDAFTCAVQNILNFVIPEDDSWNLESESDMSDYEDDNFVKEDSSKKNEMQQYMDEMDRQLAATSIGESFVKKEDNFEDIENFTPVDIERNALKNILESYKSQLGDAGPSSNMLGPMGYDLDNLNE
ncbi:protein ecdysoneless [Coccinella septempunctata]|uniref:protein ecdysoneless n=1 Tax=Coccinella septempunctata TaxID=41139 RepID=UPI001D07DF46|nr:protein ecdysoneless [Coccinella septempunctata]